MAVIQRALFTWFLILVFLILVVIRLTQPSNWSWFIVFIPMFLFDGTVLTYSAFYLFSRCRSEPRSICSSAFVARKLQFVFVIGLKLALQILLCIKLEFPQLNIPLYYVLIPLWTILIFLVTHITISLITSAVGNGTVKVTNLFSGRRIIQGSQGSGSGTRNH